MKEGEWHRIFNLLRSNGSFYLKVQGIGNRIGLVRKEGLKTSLLPLLHQFPFRHITHFKRGSKFHPRRKWASSSNYNSKSLETALNFIFSVVLLLPTYLLTYLNEFLECRQSAIRVSRSTGSVEHSCRGTVSPSQFPAPLKSRI